MKDNYETSLTQEDFINALNEIQLTENEFNLLGVLYKNKNQSLTGGELQEYFDAKSTGATNLTFARIAEKIANYTGVFPVKRDTGKFRWWSLLAIGEKLGTHYAWQLKPEFAAALEELGVLIFNPTNKNNPKRRIARICWNTSDWTKPSGSKFKSKNKKSYENLVGFGWEEWLFDTKKLIEGYHYGFIQAVNKNWEKYQGSVMDISLYSINGETKERWWLGEIKEVEIITRDTAREILKIYKEKLWITEMKDQVTAVKGNLNEFEKSDFINSFFNLRYKPENLNIFEKPIKISKKDQAIKATYFGTLLYFKTAPNLEISIENKFQFSSGHNIRKEKALYSRKKIDKEQALFHNQMQNDIYKQFVSEFGAENVSTENNTGLHTMIDVVVKVGEDFIFYELKGYNSIKKCIREALSQLMEYAYFPNQNRARELIIISHNPVDKQTVDYLKKLREEFKIPIFYQQFDTETRKVKSKKY